VYKVHTQLQQQLINQSGVVCGFLVGVHSQHIPQGRIHRIVTRNGTGAIGKLFGPVMLVWFVAIAASGVVGIKSNPGVLVALNPVYSWEFFLRHGVLSVLIMGAVVLCVTGVEALYADLAHFGRKPIQAGWLYSVLPSLLTNYFGQGALLLSDPSAIANPFYLLAPEWAHYPMVAFATVATIIASQAIISGAYSLTQQSIQLGFLPRMRVLQTASQEMGQIYIPVVNWLLALGTLCAVMIFRSSDALGGAARTAQSTR